MTGSFYISNKFKSKFNYFPEILNINCILFRKF
nr:MAG TPA: hypothetical protein [Bacteriophage sp.]